MNTMVPVIVSKLIRPLAICSLSLAIPVGSAWGQPAVTAAAASDRSAPGVNPTHEQVEATGHRDAPHNGTPGSAVPAPPDPPSQAAPAPRTAARGAHGSEAPLSYVLERIEITGNDRTRDRVVGRFLPFEPGRRVDPNDSAFELARFRLLGTGFFRDVQLSLKKGSRRGYVVLVVELDERNTVIVNDLWMGLSADADTDGEARPLTAYGGIDVAETNLGGTGVTLGSAIGVAQNQLALRVRYLDPALLGSPWMTSAMATFNSATDFFGTASVRSVDSDGLESDVDYAVVEYKRMGGIVGVGRDLSVSTQLWGHYRLEGVRATPPLMAWQTRGGVDEPIVFDVRRGKSVLATLRATLQHDTRDQPFLPSRGWRATFTAEMGLPAASDYEYQRLDVGVQRWIRLPWHEHVLGISGFVGAIQGNAPFFEQYYVGDFSDFLPGRMLGLTFDRRPPPNLLGTAIEEVRFGHYAFELAGEYRIPLYRGSRSVFGIDLFTSLGIWGLAHQRDVDRPPASYRGLSRFPLDLTANAGFRMDTSAGGLVFAFSNVLGFIPARSASEP